MFHFLGDSFKAICCITADLMSSRDQEATGNRNQEAGLDCSQGASRDPDAHVHNLWLSTHNATHNVTQCNTQLHTATHCNAM